MARLYVNMNDRKTEINRNIYGHFSEHLGRCVYNGLYVGVGSPIPNVNGMRSDVVEALKEIRVPVLRWPGGCFADEYHWKDGVGPADRRKRMVNTHWGGVTEDNSFGTHEFMELCRQLECEPYINGNVGSGTVQEMSEWVEYLTFDGVSPMAEWRAQNGSAKPWPVRYWGVGNENWGCGGNMRAEHYADLYRQFATYLRSFGGNRLYKVACGANSSDTGWTDKVMEIAGKYMDAITLHYYTVPSGDWGRKGSATDFSEGAYYDTVARALRMDKLIDDHLQIMHRHDPGHRVGLIVDEWGTWYDVEPGTNPGFLYQQNTMRDAIVAAVTLNTFNRHSGRVVMANLAQTVNVLQAVVLTEGARMLKTPTWHVFDLYKTHQGATLVASFMDTEETGPEAARVPNLSVSASVDATGVLSVTVANVSADTAYPVELLPEGMRAREAVLKTLSGAPGSHNTFDAPETVKTGAAQKLNITGGAVRFTMPACSVALLRVNGA